MPPPNLNEKIILITGASRNIGYHTALALAKTAAQLLLNARTVGGLEQLDDAITKAGGIKPVLIPFDLTDFEMIDKMGASLFERFGKIDGVILGAAKLTPLTPLTHLDPSDWQAMLDLNCTANYRLIRSLDPLLRISPRTAILGIIDYKPDPFWGHYHISKIMLKTLLEIYQKENENSGIRVGTFYPDATDSHLRKIAFPGEDKLNF